MMSCRRTQSKERNILASSNPAMQRVSLLSLGKVRLLFFGTGLVEAQTAGYVGAIYAPKIWMTVVNFGKLKSHRLVSRCW